MHLILIEDNRDYAWLVEEMLRDGFGSDVAVTTFGLLGDALESADSEPVPDCALVDLSLPDATGLQVLERVQAAMPTVPLVVLTGAEDEQLALQAVELGAQDYLVKRRVDPEVLGRSIRYAIERKRSEDQRAELLRARAAHAEAEALSDTLSRLQDLADIAIAPEGHRLDHDALLERSLAVISADCGVLVVDRRAGSGPSVLAARGVPGLTVGSSVAHDGATGQALAVVEPLILGDISPAAAGALGMGGDVRSLLAVPLDADGRHLGALVAVSPLPDGFSEEQARLLELAAERCARSLENAAAYERERRTSATLQTGFLPHAVPKLRHGEIAVRFLPARDGPAVGGDWYDAVILPDGRLGIAIGDVTGHGAEAAVLMGQLRTALRAYALEGSAPRVVVERLNALALSLGEAPLATLVYVLLDETLSSGTYVSAGHPPPLVVTADGATALPGPNSPPVGIDPGTVFDESTFALEPGDAVCLYSDGLVEERGTDFPARQESLRQALGEPASAELLCERALAALRPTGAAEDDVALLVLRTSASGQGMNTRHPAAPESLSVARAALREWLTELGATPGEISEIQMAANEACMNVVEHAYGDDHGDFALEGYLDGQTVVIIVRDFGNWSEVRSRERGRGLKLMEALTDSVQLSFSADGTVVVLRKTLSAVPA